MKKLNLLFVLLILSVTGMAQTDGLSYQAVILDPEAQEIPGQDITNNVLINAPLTVRFTILKRDGTILYKETQETQTDGFGMINLIIGQGQPSNGLFTEIEWDGVPKNLQVDVNLDGNFKMLNKEPLTFIPYAFHRNITATGTLNVDGEVLFGNNLVVDGETRLNDALFVNNESSSVFSGTLVVAGTSTLNNSLSVTNESPTFLTGTLDVDGATRLNNTLTVEEATQLNSTLDVDGATTLNNSLTVTNESPTILTGTLIVNGITDFNNAVNINNGSPLNVTGNLNVDGATTLNDDLTVNGDTNLNSSLSVNNSSPADLSGTLNVDGATTLGSSLQVSGQTNLEDLLNVNNQSPTNLSGSLTVDLPTNLNSSLSVNNGAPTFLSGTLEVLGAITLNNNLTVNGVTNLNDALFVNNGSSTFLSGDLTVTQATSLDGTLLVEGASTLNSNTTVANASPTLLTGTLEVDMPTTLNNSLDVTNGSATNLSGVLNVDGETTLKNNVEVANQSETLLTGLLMVDGETTLNNSLEVTGGNKTELTGELVVDGVTSLQSELKVLNQSETNLSGALNVTGAANFSDMVTIAGETTINNNLTVTGTASLGSISTETIAVESNNPNYVATFTNTNANTGDGILIKLGRNHGLNGIAPLPNPLVENGGNPLYAQAIALMKTQLSSPGSITPSEIISGFGSNVNNLRSGAVIAVNDFVFNQINSTYGIAPGAGNGKTLPIVTFPSTNILQGANIFAGVTIPFVNITIPRIDLPSISVLPQKAGLPPGVLNPPIPDFIPGLPISNNNGGLPPVDIPVIPITDVPISLSKQNVYVSFRDQNDLITGEIRGQSISDFYASTICDPVYLINVLSSFVGVDLLDGLTAGAVEITNLIDAFNKIGVEYTSGNGDYAEWLERINPAEYLTAGDIVAVKGGKITKDLTDLEQIMVVSHRPIILGNVPEEGKEGLGNNVAFMGQVPVKVMGPVHTGDFIVAHPELSGYGVAIALKDMTADDFVKAVGRSWEENLKEGPKMVNTVVGVHNGDWANIMKKLEAKQRNYEQKFKAIEAQVNMLEDKADALLLESNK